MKQLSIFQKLTGKFHKKTETYSETYGIEFLSDMSEFNLEDFVAELQFLNESSIHNKGGPVIQFAMDEILNIYVQIERPETPEEKQVRNSKKVDPYLVDKKIKELEKLGFTVTKK